MHNKTIQMFGRDQICYAWPILKENNKTQKEKNQTTKQIISTQEIIDYFSATNRMLCMFTVLMMNYN